MMIISFKKQCRNAFEKNAFITILMLIILPSSSYATGLGEMTVRSCLNQSFDAEIELLGLDNTRLTDLQASAASVEGFERLGQERSYVLDYLIFKIEKNKKGKPVIYVTSIEKMTEPYLEILIDLTWPEGQTYRAYTILLDPPAYQLKTQKRGTVVKRRIRSLNTKEPGVVEKEVISHIQRPLVTSVESARSQIVYGPTLGNETIWPIAQRYKDPDVTLQQMILAIAAANPEAFADNNINGLKPGIKLKIPASESAKEIPPEKAKQEVFEHDRAWQEKSPIEHGLQSRISLTSIITPAPTFTDPVKSTYFSPLMPSVSSFLSAGEGAAHKQMDAKTAPQPFTEQKQIAALMAIAAAAIESVRETNRALNDQVKLLQAENERLQQALKNGDDSLRILQQQVRTLTVVRQGLAGQAGAQVPYSWFLLLLILTTGVGFSYWWYWVREGKELKDEPHPSAELEEILKYGCEEQKNRAEKMLDEIEKKISYSLFS